MDANILLGLSLYTLIGLAPLLYNYYVVSKRKDDTSSTKINNVGNLSMISQGNTINSLNTFNSSLQVDSNIKPLDIIQPIKFNADNNSINRKLPPIIILVVNPEEFNSDIRKLVVRYLTRNLKEKEDSMATIVSGQDVGLKPGVIGIGTTQIAEMEA